MSPYENRLCLEPFRRIGLIALIKPESRGQLESVLQQPAASLKETLSQAGVTNLVVFTQEIASRTFAFTFFYYTDEEPDATLTLLKRHCEWWNALTPHLDSHPRAKDPGQPWLRMELINIVAARPPGAGQMARLGVMAGLKPSSELTYRTLHQTNWPGVVEQMVRSHFRNWTTFLIEWGEELLLFTYYEYEGHDRAADDALMRADPVTQRWWRHTEPCLIALASPGENWTPMRPVFQVD
jgi:L-rhamnose mutarotase